MSSDEFFRNISLCYHLNLIRAAKDKFYNLVDALIMAKYAVALVRYGFSLEQIGFIVGRHLDAQPFVLRCLLKRELNVSDEVLKKFPIGSEFNFQENNWLPRDVLIRGGAETKKQQVEKELAVRRYIIIFSSGQA